jgi:hypothetical protein
MDTSKILAFRHPSQAKLLLESLVSENFGWVARHARAVTDRSDLPAVLQKIAFREAKRRISWVAWRKEDVVWFFTAEVISAPAGSGSRSALKVDGYNEKGRLTASGAWVNVPRRGWQRCAL